MTTSLATSSWVWGWEALVALGTISLALATFVLAYLTRTVSAASAADLEAQWRPVLLPGSYVRYDPALNPEAQQDVLQIEVQNAGRGPALFVRATLEPANASPEDWSLGAIAPGDRVQLVFRGVQDTLEPHAQLLLDYRDLAERQFSSSVVIARRASGFIFYDVHTYRNHSVTSLGDAVAQEGLRDVRPRRDRH